MPVNKHVRTVDSFDALLSTPFAGDVNALCWPRHLPGDFHEVVAALRAEGGITTIDDEDLRALTLSPVGTLARDALLADQALLRAHGLAPTLDCIIGYPRDKAAGPIATDVYSFHVDSAPVEADTWLCTYLGASTEGLANAAAVRRIDDAATRAMLLGDYGGPDDAGFAAHLRDHHFDLHFAPRPDAVPYAFGVGALWRIAIATPVSPVLPCIHRAPMVQPGASPRLLLIS